MKALLIENSRLFHLFLSDLFVKLGFQTVLADSREFALRQLEKDSFDIICINRYFAGSAGMDFVGELRARAEHTPVLLLTSDDEEATRDLAFRAGISEVVFKSDMKRVARSIADFVRRHGVADICGRHVLYVGDRKDDSAAIRRGLESMGLEMEQCASGEEALERVGRDVFDIVISDVLLQGQMNGLELVRAIRALPGGSGMLPVLAVTRLDDRVRRVELIRAGANDYIIEPFMAEELSVRVGNLITHKRLVDQVVEQEAEKYELEISDRLTGCYNRFGLLEFSNKYLSNAKRRGESLSMIVFDIDNFQKINSKHGNEVGDTVLKEVGTLLRRHCRAEDFVVRYGDDEFVILLNNCTKQAAMLKAGMLREEIEQLTPNRLRTTVSVGVTHTDPWLPADLDAMLAAAEKAVQRAKDRGRNCVSYRSSVEAAEPAS